MKGDRLEDTLNQLDADTNALKNLIEILRRAALWSQQNTDTDGVDWILGIDMLTEAATRLEADASEVADMAARDKDAGALSACNVLRTEISKVKDLISIFLTASVSDAEGGHPRLSWAAGFEAIFDMIGGIEKLNETVWVACQPKLAPAKP